MLRTIDATKYAYEYSRDNVEFVYNILIRSSNTNSGH